MPDLTDNGSMETGAMDEAVLRVFRGGPEDGRPVDYRVPVAPGMVSRSSSARSGRRLELQSREVRLLLRRSQRPPAAYLQDASRFTAARSTDYRFAAKSFPAHQGSRHRRFLELPNQQKDSGLPAQARRRMENVPARRRSRAGIP